ncbi:MAG: asparagine synthetase B [Deltaproteobacteria bacterium]|nr:asparagine synthetase B [Deltaproteobacteria bacterium]
MSGIVGIWHEDGEPVDGALLIRLTAYMDYRGPDGRQTWSDGSVGFGHTLLRTTWEAEREVQPCTLDGRVWILADARIDARAELTQELAASGHPCDDRTTDPEIILLAYHTWGTDCVHHLIGDFVFAIWNGWKRELLCVRDHFGIKPFYYAEFEHGLVFGNTLHGLKLHPRVSDELDDLAIADFLYYGLNQDVATTSFAAIRRLPPAHRLVASSEGIRVNRYWRLPLDDLVRYREEADYAEHFLELLRAAVSDRLRTNRLGIFMSGGLDSPGLAAMARRLFDERGGDGDVRAYTTVFDRLIPDEERYYTGLAAAALRIPVEFIAADDYEPFARAGDTARAGTEPVADAFHGQRLEALEHVAAHARVLFYGEGPDNALSHYWPAHIRSLIAQGRYLEWVADLVRYCLRNRRVPFLSNLPDRVRRQLGPTWQPTAFARREMQPGLLARVIEAGGWEQRTFGGIPTHPVRPRGYRSMWAPHWQSLFECMDPGATVVPVEWRHPYLDIRLVRYLLSVPAVTCALDKRILRSAFQAMLPEPLLLRRKTPLVADPFRAWCNRGKTLEFPSHPGLGRYLRATGSLRLGATDAAESYFQVRAIGLNFFLNHTTTSSKNRAEETQSGQARDD